MKDISIITATYNAAGVIRDCLQSVREQTVDVEHILIDGGSNDGTPAIAEKYGSHLDRIVSEPDRGIYDAMNKGLRLASGEIVGILNGDDFFSSADTLQKVSQIFEDQQIDSCYGDLVYVADEGSGFTVHGLEDTVQGSRFRVQGLEDSCQSAVGSLQQKIEGQKDFKVVRYWKSGEFDRKKFWWGWMPPHPTFFVRRSVYEKYGLFNLELGSAADYEIMLRFLVKHGVRAAYIPEVLVKMRTGGVSNASVRNRLAANRMDRKAWQVNALRPYPWTLFMKPLRKLGQWVSTPEVLKLKVKS